MFYPSQGKCLEYDAVAIFVCVGCLACCANSQVLDAGLSHRESLGVTRWGGMTATIVLILTFGLTSLFENSQRWKPFDIDSKYTALIAALRRH